MPDRDSTIIAVASPPGHAARGLVRLSGPGVFPLLGSLAPDGPWPVQGPSRGLFTVRLALPFGELPSLLIAFPGPGSYTGEDSIELQLPGNPALLARVLQAIIDAGRAQAIDIREAEPGEFTARAYFNGRLTLTEAEGVAATISARSDAELRAASWLREGAFGRRAALLADELAGTLALVEAGIDFTDQDDVVAIAPDNLRHRLETVRANVDDQLRRAVPVEQLQAIPWVVLSGTPNAGKSTLFNALLGRERAVISEVAGTTRDVLTEPLTIVTAHGSAEVMLVDLAGLDAEEAELNQQMRTAASAAIRRAELVLECAAPDDDRQVPLRVNTPVIRVRTKCDLIPAGEPEGPASEPLTGGEAEKRCQEHHGLSVCALTGVGLDGLRQAIASHLSDRAVSLAADAVALQPRHELRLRSARDHLAEAIDLVTPQRGRHALNDAELIAAAMRAALDDLGRLGGDITPDDVLGRVFATFCIGK